LKRLRLRRLNTIEKPHAEMAGKLALGRGAFRRLRMPTQGRDTRQWLRPAHPTSAATEKLLRAAALRAARAG
jgi:hypothetical protein